MNLLKLTERAARTLCCCKLLAADIGSEGKQLELAAALDALRKHPPGAPPLVVGLFNQCMAHGDGVVHAIGCARTAPTVENWDRVQRSLPRLENSVDNLHAAAAHRAGVVGRPIQASVTSNRGSLRRT